MRDPNDFPRSSIRSVPLDPPRTCALREAALRVWRRCTRPVFRCVTAWRHETPPPTCPACGAPVQPDTRGDLLWGAQHCACGHVWRLPS